MTVEAALGRRDGVQPTDATDRRHRRRDRDLVAQGREGPLAHAEDRSVAGSRFDEPGHQRQRPLRVTVAKRGFGLAGPR
jgi:hypothetical protein